MTSADSLNRQAAEFQFRGDEEAARLHYLAALSVDPWYVPAMANLATILSNRNQLAPAATLLRRIVTIFPNDGIQWSNLGNILTRLERYDEAQAALDRARAIIPDNVGLWHNLVLLSHRIGDQDAAMDYMNRIEALGGRSGATANDKAHILLAVGDLEAALVEYEARWHTLMHLEPWDFYIPEWQGESLDGKRILFHAEQGFGDTIMTSRFTVELTELGAKVTLGLPGGLCRLFDHQMWTNVDTLDIAKMTESDAKRFDFHSPMYSAMKHLGITKDKIEPYPYLIAPEIVGPTVYRGGDVLNVGICWASGKRGTQMDWRRRVSSLKSWLRLANDPRVQLWSLVPEKFARDEIAELGAEAIINDLTSTFEDFADTAAFINQLDLVITVDTAIAHLAGAMGKQVWMLSQFTPCWRWWDLANGTGKPWYESMSIVRQIAPGDWDSQLALCEESLGLLIPLRRVRAAE